MSRRAMPRLRAVFGRRLLELRRARGLSQDRLGTRTGLSGKFLGEVERGEKSISLDNLARVARAVGVPARGDGEGAGGEADMMTWRAPYLDVHAGLFIPCVVTWDPKTGEFGRVEGPRGFETWEEAEEAGRFL